MVDSTYRLPCGCTSWAPACLPWKSAVVNDLRSAALEEWINGLVDSAEVTRNDFGMQFVG